MPADKFGRCSYVGTCLNVWPTWWCVSCHPDGDGCMVETYLEFKLCPSHWSPLAPWLTLPQGSHPKNKGTAPGYMLSQLIISLYVCVDGKKSNAKADRHAHRASSDFSYNRRICLVGLFVGYIWVKSKFIPALSSIIIPSALIKGTFLFLWPQLSRTQSLLSPAHFNLTFSLFI